MSLMGFGMVIVDSEPVTLAVMVDDEGNEVLYALDYSEQRALDELAKGIEYRINVQNQVMEVA